MAKNMSGGMMHGDKFLAPEMFDPASGMEQEQAHEDRVTYRTTMSMLTGGEQHDLGKGTGPVVGTPYDDDPMGQERHFVTYEMSGRESSRGDAGKPDAPMVKLGKEKGMISGGLRNQK